MWHLAECMNVMKGNAHGFSDHTCHKLRKILMNFEGHGLQRILLKSYNRTVQQSNITAQRRASRWLTLAMYVWTVPTWTTVYLRRFHWPAFLTRLLVVDALPFSCCCTPWLRWPCCKVCRQCMCAVSATKQTKQARANLWVLCGSRSV